MHIWRAVRGEGSKKPEPRVLPKLNLAHHLPQRVPGVHGSVVLVELDIL